MLHKSFCKKLLPIRPKSPRRLTLCMRFLAFSSLRNVTDVFVSFCPSSVESAVFVCALAGKKEKGAVSVLELQHSAQVAES